MVDSGEMDGLRLDMVGGIPVVRLAATLGVFDRVVDAVAGIVARMQTERQPHLLVDASDVGFAPPSLVDRLRMVRRWAEAAGGQVRIAVLCRPDFIDAERFGVVAAGQFGLAGQAFDSEADALQWLREEHAADVRRRQPV